MTNIFRNYFLLRKFRKIEREQIILQEKLTRLVGRVLQTDLKHSNNIDVLELMEWYKGQDI